MVEGGGCWRCGACCVTWFAAEAHVHEVAQEARRGSYKPLFEIVKAHSSLVPIYLTTASHDHHMSSFIQYLPCASHEPSHDPPHISLTTLNTNLLILIGVLIPSLVPESIVQITTGKESSTQGQFGLTLVRPSTAMTGAPRSWAPTFLPGDTPEE
jgi:hypothetical protein